MDQKVDPDRIKGLSDDMKRLQRRLGDGVTGLTKDLGNIISDIKRDYPEPEVRAAAYETERLIRQIQNLARSIDDRLGSKAYTLARVAQDYVRIEKETEQKIHDALSLTSQMESMAKLTGGKGSAVIQVKLAAGTPGEDFTVELVVNETNLAMLLQQYEDEEGYTLFAGEVIYRDLTMEHIPLFMEFALAKGFDPETFEYLEYRDRSEAYRRLEDTTARLKADQQAYKEHLTDGYEHIAFGRGFLIGLDNSVNQTTDQVVEIVSNPIDSTKAALQGIKQIYLNVTEEAGKFMDDPLGYVKRAANNQWNAGKKLYNELKDLEPSQRWERIGEMAGEAAYVVASSLIGGGIAGQAVNKVSLIMPKIDVDIPEIHRNNRELEERKRFEGTGYFKVDPAMQAADEAAGVLKNGSYIKNPTAKNLSDLITDSGKIGSKQMSGQYMYVVDTNGNIIIGTRAGQKMPHPTLVGGENPQVKAAGIVEIRGGQIYKIDNSSGHYKPSTESLKAAEEVFGKLPSSAFSPSFQGYVPYNK